MVLDSPFLDYESRISLSHAYTTGNLRAAPLRGKVVSYHEGTKTRKQPRARRKLPSCPWLFSFLRGFVVRKNRHDALFSF
jgi:hypothetical protein